MISAAVIEALKEIVPADKVLLQEPMKLHTTFRIGGPADCLVYLENEEQLCKIQKYLRLVDVPYTVIGNGSNLLVSDQGYAGIVLVVGKHMSRIEVRDCYLEAEAGALMSQVAKAAKEHGLTGLEFAAGIPGTIGGGAVMNAGAYDGEMSQVVTTVTVVNRNGEIMELDYESVAYLRENFPALEDNIIEDDFLKLNLEKLFDGKPFVLTGNYPYNISSQIFFKMLDYKDLIPCCTGMIQKEVAERIAAGPGSKTYGILSILIQAWYKVEYLFTVHEHVFNPPPKVKSAVIRMTRNETTELGCNEKLFKLIVKTTFNQRRKTLRNSISSILDKENPLSTDPIFNKRPEQLSVQEFIELTNQVEAALKNKTDIVYSNDIARKGTNKKE